MPGSRRAVLAVACPYCKQPAWQRCIVKGSKPHPLVPPTYYGPTNFHAARVRELNRVAPPGGTDGETEGR